MSKKRSFQFQYLLKNVYFDGWNPPPPASNCAHNLLDHTFVVQLIWKLTTWDQGEKKHEMFLINHSKKFFLSIPLFTRILNFQIQKKILKTIWFVEKTNHNHTTHRKKISLSASFGSYYFSPRKLHSPWKRT